MANRFTTHVLKNSDIVNRPLPSSLLAGEPIINTADGVMYMSGVTSSTNEWTPAGTGTTANFFEVGSNLYDLRLRNKITKYEGASGGGLVGKFLSGTTSGFVLADIADIATSTDSYVTGGTYNSTSDEITLRLNLNKPNVVITGVSDTFTTGSTLIGNTAYFNTNAALSAYTLDLSSLSTVDTYVTGYTYNGASNTFTIAQNEGQPNLTASFDTVSGLTVNGNLTVTGNTVLGSTTATTFNASTILSGGTNLLSIINDNDTFATGMTYSPSTNTITVTGNNGFSTLNAGINAVSGLSVSNLTSGRVVYVGAGGALVDEAGFTYNTGTNVFSVPSDGGVNVGTAGLNVAGDTIIQGSLTVFGPSVSAFTSQLYVEDPNIELNYNPTGSTTSTSVGAGITIQDGNGLTSGSVSLSIRELQGLTGLTGTEIPDVTEYTAGTGYENRGFVTQLNDIVIRSANITTPSGVRVLAEFDVLDGGVY